MLLRGAKYLEDDDSRYPGFRIPMQLTSAAFTEDGAKKKSSSLRLIGSAPGAAARSASSVSTLRSELEAKETDRGTLVSLPGDVLFDTDKAEIRAAARPTLDKLAELIKSDSSAKVAVEGHTDSQGRDQSFDEVEYVEGLENPTEGSFNIVRWLVKVGHSDEDIAKVMGGNALRLLRETWVS